MEKVGSFLCLGKAVYIGWAPSYPEGMEAPGPLDKDVSWLLLFQAIQQGTIKCNFSGVALGDSWISPVGKYRIFRHFSTSFSHPSLGLWAMLSQSKNKAMEFSGSLEKLTLKVFAPGPSKIFGDENSFTQYLPWAMMSQPKFSYLIFITKESNFTVEYVLKTPKGDRIYPLTYRMNGPVRIQTQVRLSSSCLHHPGASISVWDEIPICCSCQWRDRVTNRSCNSRGSQFHNLSILVGSTDTSCLCCKHPGCGFRHLK